VGHQVQAQFAAAREHACELLGRVADLAAVEAHADDLAEEGLGLLQRLEGRLLAQVAQEAQDQRGADAQVCLRIDAGAVQPVDHRFHRHAAFGMGLRVEEQLGVQHVVGRGAHQVGARHVVKILLVQQYAGARVVDIEEALQVGEGIGAAQRLHVGIGQREAVALRQREDQLGLQ